MLAESFRVRVADGCWLDAVVAGPPDGTPVVLHHGTPDANANFWPPHVDTATEHCLRLVRYSRGSDRHPGRTVADYAADALSGTKVTKLSFYARRSEALEAVWLGD
jgi:pimeloyl-ACP methyl ester carboxylesterase